MSAGHAQPEALRLADALRDGTYLLSVEREATEGELRRLHAMNQALLAQFCDATSAASGLLAQRDQLLAIVMKLTAKGPRKPPSDQAYADAVAAIAALAGLPTTVQHTPAADTEGSVI